MSRAELPDAPACARNRDSILMHLARLLCGSSRVLEVGSGTGQHAVYFAPRLPHLQWQTSERAQELTGVESWLVKRPSENLPAPLQLDVDGAWPGIRADAIFTANTLHILSMRSVQHFFCRVADILEPDGLLIVYGPMKIKGEFVGSTNADFDLELKTRDPERGIRDLEWLDQLATDARLSREELNYLPANNQLVVWRKNDNKE
ncbi:class I SAM-dependent methyltransferase [Microbulbifer sp. OS29]|uniref:Class I SAM-dependent methyltransferase n=1 Tax=Microbulbifer okhotskensis TaxID=2926617 RepID=A0A9X2EJG9_9GAMM|nr:DUF938 domain-containing protein [Microbulbifer okhotskensis]MCO1332831.1 class I SAM-dependent methyltransferase [Microbulbifer okhotskensis]